MKHSGRWALLVACFFAIGTELHAQADLDLSTTFTAADGVRTTMDVAGAWDGTNDVTGTDGDTFTLTIDNSAGTTDAFDITLVVTLPTGFDYVSGTASGVGGISAGQVGTTLTFSFPPNTDVDAGDSEVISFGLVTDSSVTSGTYEVAYALGYGTTDGASDGAEVRTQTVGVVAGASVLSVDPPLQSFSLGDTVTWSVAVTNSGLGGLFDVELDEALINPNPAGSLSLVAMAQVSPVGLTATGDVDTLTLPYLGPGETFELSVSATVTGCSEIANVVATADRTGATAATVSAHVSLDLSDPLIDFTVPDVSLDYSSPVSLSFSVANLGRGDAESVVLRTDLELLGVSLSNVHPDWSYDSITGDFTLLANGGALLDSASATLSFDVAPLDVCASLKGGVVVWTPSYQDPCGQGYLAPVGVSALLDVSVAPSVALTVLPDLDLLEVGATTGYTIRLSVDEAGSIQEDPLVITTVLPAGVTAASVTAPGATVAVCAGSCSGGDLVTWTVDHADIVGDLDLDIAFTAPVDPCLGGGSLDLSADVVATSSEGCDLTVSADASILLISNPGAGVAANLTVTGGPFETGEPDDGDGIRNGLEGEFINYSVSYTFDLGVPGIWLGSTIELDFDDLPTQTLVAGSATIEVDGALPLSIGLGDISLVGNLLEFDLGFVGTLLGGVSVAGHDITVNFQTTISDDDLLGADSRTFTQLVELNVQGSGGGSGCGGDQFTQGAFVAIERAAPTIDVSIPSEVSLCEEFPVTVTIGNGTSAFPSNLRVTVDTTGDYDFPTGQVPTLGGFFNVGNITFDENGGVRPTFSLTPTSLELSALGTISFNLRKRAGTAASPSAVSVALEYDDLESSGTPARDFASVGNATPVVVHEGSLSLLVTPDEYVVIDGTATWTLRLTNTGAGVATDVALVVVAAADLTPNDVASDTLNPSFPVAVLGQQMTWIIGDLAVGATQTIGVVVDVDPTGSCTFTPGSNSATATWGCDGIVHQTVAENSPDLLFLDGDVQAYHDTTASRAQLCDTGSITIVALNTGSTHVFNVEITEVLEPATSGVDYVPGTGEYSTDGGSNWNPAGEPTGAGTAASPYTWDSTAIPPLADLAPVTEGAGVTEVWLRFDASSTETANGGDPSITAGLSGDLACGGSVNSPGTPFTLPVEKPEITVSLTARNVTNSGAFAETAYGGDGDTIEWRVRIDNDGDHSAQNLRLAVDLPNSAPTSTVIDGTGFSSTPYTDAAVVTLSDLAAGATEIYTITQVLGSTCVDATATATATWGCVDPGPTTAAALSTPTDNVDTADLVMLPDFSGSQIAHQFTPLQNGLTQVRVSLTNAGGRAHTMELTETLPAGLEIDTSFTPTVTSTGNVSAVSLDATDPTAPVFTLTGTLINGTRARVFFHVLPVTDFDTTTLPLTSPETAGSGDPTPPAGGASTANLTFESSCGDADSDSRAQTLNPATPDLDMTVSPDGEVVADGDSVTYVFTITNNGDSGSVAGNISFEAIAGAGWSSVDTTITTPGSGGSNENCSGSCTVTDFGTLDDGDSAVVTVTATANDNGGALSLVGRVTGSLTGGNYSLDDTQVKVVGFETTLTASSTSESFTTGSDVAVGEEVTWGLNGRFFGGEPLTSVTARVTLPTELGYVSHAATGSHDVTISAVSGDSPVDSGVIDFTVADFAGVGTFEVDLVARVLNVGTSIEAATLTTDHGYTFDAYGDTYASDDAEDAFGGSEADLHDEASLTVRRPTISVTKLVRNQTRAEVFGGSSGGEADDVFEYQVTVTAGGSTPAFDVEVTDVLATAKLVLIDGASDGIDNDGDGVVDDASEGSFTPGGGGDVTFDQTSTALAPGSPSVTFDQLDAGESLTLLYRAAASSDVNPLEVLSNGVTVTANTLPGASGSQSSSVGATGDTDGEAEITDTDSVDVTIEAVSLSVDVVDTAVGGDTSTDVMVGEQIELEYSVVLPSGTAPNLTIDDQLPEGLLLVSTPAVSLGAGISGGQPLITPLVLPASGNPLAVQWDFGTRTVSAGSAASRTVTVTAIVQVRNIAANADGTTLSNLASYSYTGAPANSTSVTLTVREPDLAVTQSVAPTGSFDAGATLTYTVSIVNSGSATARDLDLTETLASGLSYVAGSTTVTAGPAVGEPDTGGGVVTWGRSQSTPQTIDLDAGQTLTFTYEVLVGDTVETEEDLDSNFSFTATSLPGDPGGDLGVTMGTAGDADGERDGSGGTNDYTDTDSVTATAGFAIANGRGGFSGDTLSPEGFRVGDLVTVTIEATFEEGTFDAVVFEDTLPAGLAFFDAQAFSPATGSDGFTFTQPIGLSVPTLGATGTITWDLGTVVNAGDNDATNDTLTLVYRARVLDVGGVATTPTSQTVTNAAIVRYEDEGGGAEATSSVDTDGTIGQPQLTLSAALDTGQSLTVDGGETVTFELTVTNTGDAPAYNPQIVDVLDAGLRGATPVVVDSTLDGAPIVLATPSWVPGTGTVTWLLADGQPIEAGEVLVITYRATVESTAISGTSLANAATILAYHSKESSDLVERRTYAAVGPDSSSVTTASPTDISAAGNASATIGESVVYVVTVPQTPVSVTLEDVTVTDTVPSELRVTSVVTNAATIGTTVADSTVGNAVDVEFDQIGPGDQAVVIITAVIENQLGTEAADVISNSATFTWATSDGGAQNPGATTTPVQTTVVEPELTVVTAYESWALFDSVQGLQAGDTVTYSVTVTNTGLSPAHDITLRDIVDDELSAPVITADPDDPGVASSSNTAGGFTTTTYDIAGPIAGGASYTFDVTYTVLGTVTPFQVMPRSVELEWTSIAGASADERDGSGGVNDYTASSNSVDVTSGPAETILDDAASDSDYAPGEEVVHRFEFGFGMGSVDALTLRHLLPAGLEFVSATFTDTNVEVQGGGAVTLLSGPTAGDTGTLVFDFGDLASTGPAPRLELDVTLRVQDVPGNTDGTDLDVEAEARFEFPAASGLFVNVVPIVEPTVSIVEPDLVAGLDGPTTVGLVAESDLTYRIDNVGTHPGYQPTVVIEYPSDLRDTDPTTLASSATISGGRSLTLTAGVDYNLAYVGGTGQLTFTSLSATAYVDIGETLTLAFQALLDEDATDAAGVGFTGTVTQFTSVDTSASIPDETRTYTTVLAAGTTGTADGATGDDPTDDLSTTTERAIITVTQSVDAASVEPSDVLHYQLTIANTGSVDATLVDVSQSLDSEFAAGSLTNLVVSPATGSSTITAAGGANGTGLLTLDDLTIVSGGSVTIDFDATLIASIPDGSMVSQQASVSVPGYASAFVSDSTSGADDDLVEAGNDPADAADDDPTRSLVGSMPILDAQLTAADVNGAPLEADDVVRYTLTVTNSGNEDAVNSVWTNAMPPNGSYVAGSTRLEGVAVPDVGGASPLVAGFPIQTPGEPSGRLAVGETATITYRVRVTETAVPGAEIENQATLAGEGEASGSFPEVLSDDPSTTSVDDPTVVVVGAGPGLEVIKVATDADGAPLLPGDTITYAVTVTNGGTEALPGVVVTDPIPTGTTYTASSAQLDADGPVRACRAR